MKSFQVADFNAPLKEVDQPTPQPTGTQVLIKVKAAGVCHSDLHIWEGGYDLGHGRKPLSLKDRGVSLPRTMGHETVGEVVAFGPDVTAADRGDLKVGDVALVYPWLGCGKCETCLGGDENMCVVKPNSLGVYCDGGYADHMTVPNPKYLLQSEGLDPVTARALCLFRRHHLQCAEEDRVRLELADRPIFGAGGARADGAVAVEGDGRHGRHRRRHRCAQARSGRSRRCARHRRRQGPGRACAHRCRRRWRPCRPSPSTATAPSAPSSTAPKITISKLKANSTFFSGTVVVVAGTGVGRRRHRDRDPSSWRMLFGIGAVPCDRRNRRIAINADEFGLTTHMFSSPPTQVAHSAAEPGIDQRDVATLDRRQP